MKLLNTIGWVALAALVLTGAASAQSGYTSVTATVTDVSGNPYAGGRYQITFVYQGAAGTKPLLSGSVFQQQVSGSLDSSGKMAVSLADNNSVTPAPSQWNFQICAAAGNPCFSALLTITGSSQDISTALTAVAPPLHAFSGGTVFGGITATGLIQAQSIEQVRYADQFPGADIGAKINAAIAAVGCGTVVVPTGSYSFTTPIIKPRCVVLRGEGAGYNTSGTVLTWTPSTGVAIAVGDGTGGLLYSTGGIEDLTLIGPGNTDAAIGVWLGGDPAGTVLPSGDSADFQTLRNVRISQFGTGLKWGSNAWLDQFFAVKVFFNGVGIDAASGLTNSAENNAFFGGAIFNNTGAAIAAGVNVDLQFLGTSFDFNGAPSAGATFISCHFEQNSGAFVSGPGAIIIGGFAGLDATTGTDAAMFLATGTAGGEWYIYGLGVNSNHAVTDLVSWNITGGAPHLFVDGIHGNDNNLIAATTNQPYSLGSYVNAQLIGSWATPQTAGGNWQFGSVQARDSGESGGYSLDLFDDGNGGDAEPHKYLRVVAPSGQLQIVNSAFTAPIWSLSDGGVVTFTAPPALPSTYTVGANTITQPSTSGTLALMSALPLSGTTAAIGGAALAAGVCTTGTVAVTGATTAMAVAVSPAADPGTGFTWEGWVSAAGTVSVRLCNVTAGSLTPTAEAYNVRVIQ